MKATRRIGRVMAVMVVMVAAMACGEGLPEPGLVMYGLVKARVNGVDVRLTTGTLQWTLRGPAGQRADVSAALTNIADQFCYVLQVPFETCLTGMGPSSNMLQLGVSPGTYTRHEVQVDGNPSLILPPALTNFSFGQAERGHLERVDLEVFMTAADEDGDTLPDFWEQGYFHNLWHAPGEDDDGDGADNGHEFVAGTNPTDPGSVFELIETEWLTNGVLVRWKSTALRRYALDRSVNLLTGFAPLASNLVATPPLNLYIDTTAVTNGLYFYRIKTQ